MTTGKALLSGLAALGVVLMLAGCQTDSRQQILATTKSQVELRSFQTRAFDTTDKEKTLRTVMATLQDLSFVLDKADAVLGTVSGTKLDGYQLRITVTVRPRGETQMLVRANAQYNITAVEDPEPYQQFFAALGRAMFLTAHEVD
jgi:exosome complex RNA-binding protein Csl4